MGSELTPTALKDLEPLPESWARARLDQVSEVFDCPHSTPNLTAAGPYLIRTQDIRTGVVRLDGVARVSEETYRERIKRAEPRFGDLLYSREGTYFGVAAEVPYGEKVCLGQRMVHLRPTQEIDWRFLKYWLNSPLMARHISGLRDGSVAERLNMSTIRSLPVAYPELQDQQKIAAVLGALDDRVELLRNTSLTLEAIAQTLFKSWFVDFDPVRAKAEGREPEGIDAATAALFPSEFEDSELGLIPKGWRVGPFSSAFECTMGQSPPGATYNKDGAGTAFFQGCNDFGDVFPARRVFTTAPSRFAKAGDVLMSVRAPVGAVNLAASDCAIGRGLCAIRHKSGSTGLTIEFVKACVHRIEDAAGEGALFKSLSKEQLAGLPVVSAGQPLLVAAIEVLEPIVERRLLLARQAEALAQLRDTLLPRLISGKLRLPDADSMLQDATA